MSRRRYVYSYSPRRTNPVRRPSRNGGRHLALWLAPAAALVLVGVWVAARGGSPSAGSGAQESRPTATTAGGQGPKSAQQSNRLQGGDAGRYGKDSKPPAITALAAAVIEEPCGAVLHKLNAGLRLPPASLTKVATALVAVEHDDLSETVNVDVSGGALSASTDATIMGIEPGDRLSVRDLLYGMLLPSGMDAAIAIADHTSGSLPPFVKLMNAKVEQLGLNDTQFTNPHGLDDPGLYTSAYDIAMLARELLRNSTLAEIVRTRSYQPDWGRGPVQNHNLLLSQYPGALGVKTGYTDQAGQTIVAAADRSGRRIIVSVLGSKDIYVDATALLDWAFDAAPRACAG